MRASTALFGTTVTGPDTEPVTALSLTWPAAVTGVPTVPVTAVGAFTTQGSFTTDMPEGTKLITGYPARTATLVLTGQIGADETQTAQWLFDPWSPTSPLYGQDWTGQDGVLVVVQQGLQLPGVVAPELFPVFTGFVDKLSIDRATGQVSLELIDRRVQLSNAPTLPMVVASNPANINLAPGLTGLWPLDYVLRNNGIFSGPPPRAGCVWYCSGHGSLWPEVAGPIDSGSLLYGAPYVPANPTPQPPTWVPGRFAGQAPAASYHLVPATKTVSTKTGGLILFEGWILTAAAVANGSVAAVNVRGSASGNGVVFNIGQDAAGRVNVYAQIHRAAGIVTSTTTGLSATAAGWHQITAYVQFTATATAVLHVWLDGAAQTAITISGFGAWTDDPGTIQATSNLPIDTWQVTSGEAAPTPAVFATKCALSASLNNLTAIPAYTANDAWGLIQQIVEAEFGVAGFDEADLFYFRNRNDAPTTAAATVTSLTQVKELQFSVNEATRARTVTAPVHPLTVGSPQVVWAATEVYTIPPFQTIKVFATLPTPTAFIPAGRFTIAPPGGVLSPFATNQYRGTRPGYNGDRTVVITATQLDSVTVLITAQNIYPYPVQLVSPPGAGYPSTSNGQPTLVLVGQPVAPVSSTSGSSASTGVITVSSSYGTGAPALALTDSLWRQDPVSTQQLTDDELSDLLRPRPLIDQLDIVGDPRLQLGDRVQVQDTGEFATSGGYRAPATLADDLIIISISASTDPQAGFVQTIVGRLVAAPRQWVLGQAGRSELGTTTWV